MASCAISHPAAFLRGASNASPGVKRSSSGDAAGSSTSHCCFSSSSRTAELCHSVRKGLTSGQRASSLFWESTGGNRRRKSSLSSPGAKRKSRGGSETQLQEEELDEDMQLGLNEISTEALKAMLSEYDKEVALVREKVEYLGEYLVQEKQIEAARFMLVLRGMLDHELVPQKDDLKGPYKKAYDKIVCVIEDSGWVLKQEGADIGGVEMVDDELMPPVLNSQY